jgi:2-methylcitrate dehydratase PrpD
MPSLDQKAVSEKSARDRVADISFLTALGTVPREELPDDALGLARISLLDWLICGVAGRKEPVADALRAFAGAEADASGPLATASLFGGKKAPPRLAAMVNGTISHALDFDDTHFDHVGHLSVGIYPAVLAISEDRNLMLPEMVAAFLTGAEGAIRLGRVLGAAHYNKGFHQTATAGAFGATLAAGRLAGLDQAGLARALSLCTTRASGLKSQFGTMGKPLNAGISASNGIEAVALAKLGVTSADDGIFGPQGFVETHAEAPDLDALLTQVDREGGCAFRFLDNRYKFHACCHGLHAMIEGLLTLQKQRPFGMGDVARLTVRTNPRWLKVCDIKRPRTGLEVKFSYNWLAGMVAGHLPTGDDRAYTDGLAQNADLRTFATKITVFGDPALTDQQADGAVQFADGTVMSFSHDLAQPQTITILLDKIRAKARALLKDQAGPILEVSDAIEATPETVSARQIGDLIRAH